MSRHIPTAGEQDAIDRLRLAGYHVERQGTYDNRLRRLEVLARELFWAVDEKRHHEQWLAGILAESSRLQQRFNKITAALASSGVEWDTIAALIDPDPADSAGGGAG